jgi:GAF domain-containing protein
MTIQSSLPGAFDRQDIATLQLLADQLANAIETTRLYAASRDALERTQMLYQTSRVLSSSLEEGALMRAVLDSISRDLQCKYAIISTVDEDARVIRSRYGVWQGEHDVYPEWMTSSTYDLNASDILVDVYRTAQTEIISGWDDRFNKEISQQYDHDRLLRMFVPIEIRDRVIGVVEVAYDIEDKQFINDAEVDLVQALVDQIAVALENARLLTATRHALQETEMLYNTSRRLAAANSAAEMLSAVAEESDLPEMTRALMWLILHDDVDQSEVAASIVCWRRGQGIVPVPAHMRLFVQDASVQQNLVSGPRYVDDAGHAELAFDAMSKLIAEWQIVSLACVPVSDGQRRIGVLMLAGDKHHSFTASEKRRFESLSSQLAVGLDRLYLTQRVHDSFESEQALRQMTDRVRSAIDIEGVMHTAVRETGRLLGRSAFIYLGDQAGFVGSAGDGQNGH